MAAKYRKWSHIFSLLLLAALPFWLLAAFGGSQRDLGIIGFVVVWICGVFGCLALLRIRCPACCENADGSSGKFCPECGADALKGRGFWDIGSLECRECGSRLSRGRGGRRYKIRFCRNCGAHLDDLGL